MTTKRNHTGEFKVLNAYQHFLYYLDQTHLYGIMCEKDKWGEHLTDHFMEKLAYYRHTREKDYNSIDVIVTWVQNMSPEYQQMLLNYIVEFHSNKW